MLLGGLCLLCCHAGSFGLVGLFLVYLKFGFGLLGGSHLLLCGTVGSGSVGFGMTAVGHTLVELLQIGGHLLGIIGLPELEVGTSLQEFAHTLRFLDARHFHHDAAFLAFKLLDVGLHHAKLVDTSAHHIERVVDGGLHLSAQCFLHFGVGTLWRNLALQLLGGEHLSQLVARSILVIGIDKQRDEITVGSFFFFGSCLSHRLCESHVGLVIGQCLDNIGHGNLKDNVHTAFQVKSETDLSLQALLVRINAQIFHRILVILLGNRILYLCRLAVVIARGSRERQIEDTCERQQDGYYNY